MVERFLGGKSKHAMPCYSYTLFFSPYTYFIHPMFTLGPFIGTMFLIAKTCAHEMCVNNMHLYWVVEEMSFHSSTISFILYLFSTNKLQMVYINVPLTLSALGHVLADVFT